MSDGEVRAWYYLLGENVVPVTAVHLFGEHTPLHLRRNEESHTYDWIPSPPAHFDEWHITGSPQEEWDRWFGETMAVGYEGLTLFARKSEAYQWLLERYNSQIEELMGHQNELRRLLSLAQKEETPA